VSGVSRAIRENLTELILFKNKQDGVMEAIMKELGGAVDPEQFQQAYDYALQDKHDSLCISFNPKCPTLAILVNDGALRGVVHFEIRLPPMPLLLILSARIDDLNYHM